MMKYYCLQNSVRSIKVLISKVLTDSNISRNEFVLINNVQKEFDDTKKRNEKY